MFDSKVLLCTFLDNKTKYNFNVSVDDDQGKEVILTYTKPEIENNGVFWTDSNGRQMIRRVRNQRPSYTLTDGDQEPVASNYYPVATS